jgi:DNA-binding MurR/RpiR family transcriptional regulator
VAALTAGAAESAVSSTYERAVDLIMDARQVNVLGGRFSRHVAAMLAGYLMQFRSGVSGLGALSAESFDALIDISKRDVLVVFDYRRYQANIVEFTRQASERGVRVILFTDPWLSPISAFADLTLTCPVEVDSPYDSLVGAVAQMEALVAQVVARESGTMNRMEDLEQVRSRNRVSMGREDRDVKS